MVGSEHFLRLGLIAMSKSMNFNSWFHGHLGAEILTNTFFILDLSPAEQLRKVIRKRILRIITSRPGYFDGHTLTDNSKSQLSRLELEVDNSTSNLANAGHGVIFGSLALKAIYTLGGWLPQNINDGIVSLLKNTHLDSPYRYFGNYGYQNRPLDLYGIPDFETPDEAARYVLKHQDYFEDQVLDGQYYHFHGNQIHDITHANALVTLDEMGYKKFASQGILQLRKQIKLGQVKPPKGKKYVSKMNFNPLEPSFWMRDVADEHHFKLAYATISLLTRYRDIDRNSVFRRLSGHWELMN